MAPMNLDAPVLDTYQAVVAAYRDFLTVAIHTILYERNIYPAESFLKARKYNHPVRQNRHPKVCKWIQDAVAAVEVEMLKCSVATTSLIIHGPPPDSTPLERYVFSTAAFPRIPASETLTPFAPSTDSPDPATSKQQPLKEVDQTAPPAPQDQKRYHPPPTSNLPEQFRATLSRLTTSLPRLLPLPEDCSFTLAIELREEEGVGAPLGARQEERRWVAAEPGWQRGPDDAAEFDGLGRSKKGRYLGGVRTTPVRSLEAGAFAMEVWIEEGKGKFRAGVEDDNDEGDN